MYGPIIQNGERSEGARKHPEVVRHYCTWGELGGYISIPRIFLFWWLVWKQEKDVWSQKYDMTRQKGTIHWDNN